MWEREQSDRKKRGNQERGQTDRKIELKKMQKNGGKRGEYKKICLYLPLFPLCFMYVYIYI